jgi:hypothetical protein
MIVTANTEPIALSIVEGCAQSTRSNAEDWNTGVLEWWNNGVKHLKPNIPIFQHSIFFQQPVRRQGIFVVRLKNPNAQWVTFLN